MTQTSGKKKTPPSKLDFGTATCDVADVRREAPRRLMLSRFGARRARRGICAARSAATLELCGAKRHDVGVVWYQKMTLPITFGREHRSVPKMFQSMKVKQSKQSYMYIKDEEKFKIEQDQIAQKYVNVDLSTLT